MGNPSSPTSSYYINGIWSFFIPTATKNRHRIWALAWAHERTPLANLIRWRDKPVALSIVQARLVGLRQQKRKERRYLLAVDGFY
jgi:hypothetical protein